MMKYKFKISLILLLKSYLCFSQTALEVEVKIDSLFEEYSGNTPGVAVAVVQDGKVAFKKGYGLANLEYNLPIRTNTPFNVGSVSKQFTAFAAYLLQEEGKISLEDDIRKYVPELPKYKQTIKIKHLLGHTSGLKDQWALLTLAGWRLDDVITEDHILKLVSQQKELNFETGTQFMYSNTGYTLVAMMIERVSGKSFATYCQEQIFIPLEMNDTQFYDDYHNLIENRAYSYEKSKDGFVNKKLNYVTVGPTGLFTTVEDLAKWVSNFHNPVVGNLELIKEFNEVSYLNDNEIAVWSHTPEQDLYYAKGQLSYYYKGLKVLSHGGHDAGFKAVLTRFPEQEFAVITLSNNEHYTMVEKSYPLAELFLEDELIEKPRKEVSNTNQTTTEEEQYDNQLESYEGVYYNEELATQYEIKLQDTELVMLHQRLDDIALKEIGENKFSGSGINTFYFELAFFEKNEVEGFRISNFGAKNVRFNKLNDNQNSKNSSVAIKLVNRQLNAYNSRDIDNFILPYDKDVKIFNFPNALYGSGIDFIKENYERIFSESPNLNCQVINRTILGNTVIDHERVSGLRNMETFEAIAIYKIENQKIAKVYFIRKDE